MSMSPLQIDGRTYEHVQRYRPHDEHDVRIYRGNDQFVRIGPAPTVDAILAIHTNLTRAGIPVPRITSIGTLGGEKYFMESSLGDETLRRQFAREVEESGSIREESFRAFTGIVRRYLLAQGAARIARDEDAFLRSTHVHPLADELPEEAARIRARAAEHLAALADFPFVLSHGDFSPSNLFEGGAIDLEESMPAPFGYDAVCALTTSEWYPGNSHFEFRVTPYHFTASQRREYLALCDEVSQQFGFPPISAHVHDFDFFRAAWLTEGMQEWPKTQAYRHDRFVKHYL